MSSATAATTAAPAPAPATTTYTADEQTLVTFLALVNGQDCYDAKAEAIGRLSKDHYLKVPVGLAPYAFDASKVGKQDKRLTPEQYAQIYVLNKDVFGSPREQVAGALLRAELVNAGWYTGTYEVEEKAVPVGALTTMHADYREIEDLLPRARVLALLLPLAAEHTFRTMGHHYITAMAAEYEAKYSAFFSACVIGNATEYLPGPLLYHRVAHWVSLSESLAVAKDSVQQAVLPNAVLIRSTAAPAGTALITTSEAVLNALAGTGIGDDLKKYSGVDTDKITMMSKEVKANPGKYHTIPTAYGVSTITPQELANLNDAKDEARKLAPVLQGFIDSLPRQSDLTGARALAKHADVNPVLRTRAKKFFKEIGTTKAGSIRELFAMRDRHAEAAASSEIEEEEY